MIVCTHIKPEIRHALETLYTGWIKPYMTVDCPDYAGKQVPRIEVTEYDTELKVLSREAV